MTTTDDTNYLSLLAIASYELQRANYPLAKKLLSQCLQLARPLIWQRPWDDTALLNYCKTTILLAATRLRLQQSSAALHDFSQALQALQRLHAEAADEETRATIRRYQAVLIRANQTACTLSRLSNSVQVSEYDYATAQRLPH